MTRVIPLPVSNILFYLVAEVSLRLPGFSKATCTFNLVAVSLVTVATAYCGLIRNPKQVTN